MRITYAPVLQSPYQPTNSPRQSEIHCMVKLFNHTLLTLT